MKVGSILLLLAVFLSLLAPLSPAAPHSGDNDKSAIFSIDICDNSGQPLSVNADTPFLGEHTVGLIFPGAAALHTVSQPLFNHLLFSVQEERPPKA